MAAINSTRIELARRRRGFTKTQLAEVAGVSTRILSDYLSGKRPPSEATAIDLARALDMPLDFFVGEDIEAPPESGVSFRAMSRMTARQRDQAIGAAAIAVELDQWIRARFHLPAPDVPHLRNIPAEALDNARVSNAETIAESLRNRWSLGDARAPNMVHLLEAHGVRVYSIAQECAEVDAFSFWRDDVPYVFLNNYKTAEHSRMDAAHELGHLVMHAHGGPSGRIAEDEAQAFGSSFLMPRRSVLADAPRGATVPQIISAKRRWNVSAMGLAHRMHRLGLLSEWQVRSTYIQLARDGYRDGEPVGIERETSQILPKVFEALKAEGTSRAQLARELRIFSAELHSVTFGLTIAKPGSTDRPVL